MVGIINYGAGNVFSVFTSVKTCGYTPFIIEKYKDIKRADIIIIPGVGSFDNGMKFFIETGIGEEIKEEIGKGKLFLGICLGLQLLFDRSEEGNLEGLGIFDGIVRKFISPDNTVKIPHMGWSIVKQIKNDILFLNIPDKSYFYFAHSYYVEIKEKDIIYGITEHCISFPSVIKKNNVVGVQFHPEKSGKNGLKFLKNFLQHAFEKGE